MPEIFIDYHTRLQSHSVALNSSIWSSILLETVILSRLVVVTTLVGRVVRCARSAGSLATLRTLNVGVWTVRTTEPCKRRPHLLNQRG